MQELTLRKMLSAKLAGDERYLIFFVYLALFE